MCPFCLATAAIVASSATGTGGLTALVAGTLLIRRRKQKFPKPIDTKEIENGNDSSRSEAEESSLAR